ncbi:MAG: hypothetical protein IPL70_19075 [Uliginosibacterium sp.]|nr:hypothetical protein [Uliginosibacterium sp.]MBK9392978.1 hypothetical protein [Uliginosibacterium sp.]
MPPEVVFQPYTHFAEINLGVLLKPGLSQEKTRRIAYNLALVATAKRQKIVCFASALRDQCPEALRPVFERFLYFCQ